MRKIILLALCSLFLIPGAAGADEFSLHGVKMGMSRTDVESKWLKSEAGEYQIPDSLILDLVPEFDHRERLYRVSFSVPIPMQDQYPGAYVTTAFQKMIQERWSSKDQTVSIRTGRGSANLTLTNQPLLEAYNEHINAQMRLQLSILLKP